MIYPLTRDGEEYALELDYEVTDFIPANMTEAGWRDEYNITLTAAWCDGKVFALSDAEIAAAEQWLMERVEVS